MAQKHTAISVSLVIPAYNEERYLAACLDSIVMQTVKPYEVIVVDNGSTDQTATIASRYPFVQIVHEPRQGVVFARDTGFNAARGDIIARIDVDTLIPIDWVERVTNIFANPEIDAVSGSISFHDAPFPQLFATVDLFARRYLANRLSRHQQLFLYGGNMAIRADAWHSVSSTLCHNTAMHEDIDLGAHMAGGRYRVGFDQTLSVAVSARRVDSDPRSYYLYAIANSRTYLWHGLGGRFYMYPVIWLALFFYPLLRILYRSYNPDTRQFSLRLLFESSYSNARISPIV
ncbi:MAG TPA: glycosyltransferase family 2 protein [Candidatus Saccharimonadales bacterium]|nr:glycosyltransferase family 2 protein [Candidatus Saccharimonadales bacterium]